MRGRTMKSTNPIVEQTLTILVLKTSIGVFLNVNEKNPSKRTQIQRPFICYDLQSKIW
jgi:hypothetical protein